MLKHRALSATLWSAVEQIGSKGLSTIFMLVFARYLTATDFGIFAAANLVIGFAGTIAKLGLSSVVVQRPDLDSRALSTAFWMSSLSALVVAGVLAATAEPLAVIFGDRNIAVLVPVLAVGMVIATASAMVTALLQRELNMKALARRTLLANAISGAIAMPFVLSGYGAWGLVVQTVGGAILTLALTVLLIGWPVRWAFDKRIAREMLCFGTPVLGEELLRQYSNKSPEIFVGVFLGPSALGIITMALRITNLFMTLLGATLQKVVFPVLSEVSRQSPNRLSEAFLRISHLAGAGVVAIFAVAITVIDPMVMLVLGPDWQETVPILFYLLIAGMVMNLNYVNSATLLALGSPKTVFSFSVLRAIIGTALLAIAIPFGLIAISIAFALRSIIADSLQLVVLLSKLNIRLSGYFSQMKMILISCLPLSGIGIFLNDVFVNQHPAVVFVVVGGGALTGYLTLLLITDKSLVIELRGLILRKKDAK